MNILGQRVRRQEDCRLLTLGGRFIADLRIDGALHVTYVRAAAAHARLGGVDVAEVREAPGVVDVITGADVDLPPIPPPHPFLDQRMTRPWLATEVVRFVGEPVVAIVSERPEQGVDAAELVLVDYDPLPALLDAEAALANEVVLFPEAETNVAFAMGADPDSALFEGCDVVVSQRLVNQRLAACPLEVRAAAATWDEERLTQWACTQFPHHTRDALARLHGLPPERVRVLTPDVGGGFGSKNGTYPEEALLGWIARRLGRPVRWVETRSESMVSLGHGRAQFQRATLGGTRDGRLLAYQLDILQDCGAYPAMGGLLPYVTSLMAPGVYDIGKVATRARSVVTTTTPTLSYRGAGRPEATAAIERMLDLFAAEIGMDPAEVRRRNLVPPGAFPHVTATGATYDTGDYDAALGLALRQAGYEALRAEQRRRREAGSPRQLGIGLCVYVEVTNPLTMGEYGSVEITADGGVVARTGSSAHGQGHETTFAMLIAEATAIPLEKIEVRHGDTDEIPRGEGTSGSRSLQTGGVALSRAAEELVEAARRLTATLLEADPDDIVLDREAGAFHVAGAPSVRRAWAELAVAFERDSASPLAAQADFRPLGSTYPFGAHLAVVEVDTETGEATLVRMVAVDDVGRVVNPLVADGQIHGGLAQGIAQALYEEFRYDADGNPLTTNLADYTFPSAADLPSFERFAMETPTPLNPLGAKGIGESGTIGATPAVQNAVVDALSHLGVRHLDMPVTPERVWQAIQRAIAEASRSRA